MNPGFFAILFETDWPQRRIISRDRVGVRIRKGEIMREKMKAVARMIRESKNVLAFTGAGISEESGIPTYRGDSGMWNEWDPSKYADADYFFKDPTYYWRFFREVRYPTLESARPNPGHYALAALEKTGKLKWIVTQNIDGLHREAGSRNVLELHGNSRFVRCLDCKKLFPAAEIHAQLEIRNPPICPECAGMLKTTVVLFGEALTRKTLDAAASAARKCDLVLAIGSSLVVYPAAHIPIAAKRSGARFAIINLDKTAMDGEADIVVHSKAGEILPGIVELSVTGAAGAGTRNSLPYISGENLPARVKFKHR